jgi:hypothetical protein
MLSTSERIPAQDRAVTDGEPSFRIFVRRRAAPVMDGWVGRLVHLLELDVYSDSLLERKARIEIKSAALILSLNFIFDMGAWTLLLNAALHSTALAHDFWTLLAIIGGLVFAAIILLYERQFYLADWTKRVGIALAFRTLVIVAAALTTAQPVELLFFQGPIQRRIHEEGIRQKAVSLRKALDKTAEERKNREAELNALNERLKHEMEYQSYTDSQQVAQDADEQLQLRRSQLDQAHRTADSWRAVATRRGRAYAEAKRASVGDDAAIEKARMAWQAARDSSRWWQSRVQDLSPQVDQAAQASKHAEEEVKVAEQKLRDRRGEIEAQIQASVQQAEQERVRLQRWIAQLAETSVEEASHGVKESPDNIVSSKPNATGNASLSGGPLKYSIPQYDFFEQLRVLKDLREGRPPLWRGASTAMMTQLADEYGLIDPKPCSPAKDRTESSCDPLVWERHLAATSTYFFSWCVIYAIALVPPALVLAMKLLMSDDLKKYYSANQQRRAGAA